MVRMERYGDRAYSLSISMSCPYVATTVQSYDVWSLSSHAVITASHRSDIGDSSPRALVARERLKDGIYESAFQGLKFGVLAIVILLAVFWFQGRQLNREKRIRGAELATARQLRRQVLSSYPVGARFRHAFSTSLRGRPYRIADVPYPEWAETQHTIVSGATSSG